MDPIFKPPAKFNEPQSCQVEDITLAYMFHPGAGDPPYYAAFRPFNIHNTTHGIVQLDAPEFVGRALKGKQPVAVVVDSSLWDMTNWWMRARRPKNDGWHQSYVDTWCEDTLPALLDVAQKTFPESRVFFRSAPTVPMPHLGQTPVIIEAMRACILSNMEGNKFRGQFEVIDFHAMFDKLLEDEKKILPTNATSQLYRDDFHPGAVAARQYILNLFRKVGIARSPAEEAAIWPYEVGRTWHVTEEAGREGQGDGIEDLDFEYGEDAGWS